MKKYKKPKILANGKTYRYEYPHLITGNESQLILQESNNGYICYLGKGEWMGLPKSIIENNSLLYTEIIKQ